MVKVISGATIIDGTGADSLEKRIYSIHKPPALFNFKSMSRDRPLTVEPFQISSRQEGGVAYEGSKK
jgi:hypothetical protein